MIKLKTILAMVGILCMVLSNVGCSVATSRDYYNDLEDYETIWTLPGFRHGYEGVSEFFSQVLRN